MTKDESIGLDLIRAVAAMLVLACHFNQLGYTGAFADALEPLGRLGVIIFFLLSGYVISHVQAEKHPDLHGYLRARFVRLHSVLVPALLLTCLLDTTGTWIDPLLYQEHGMHAGSMQAMTLLPVFLSFMNENSIFSVRWFTNGPLWSIAYEFWYYLGFGAYAYLRGRPRVVALCLVCLLGGWKIALLAPIWILGCLMYKSRHRLRQLARIWVSVGTIVSSILLLFLCIPSGYELILDVQRRVSSLMAPGYHTFFLSDYVIAVLAFVPMLYVLFRLTVVSALLREIVRKVAGFSFTLYALHVPVILFIKAQGLYDPRSAVESLGAALVVIAACWLVSVFTENRKAPWFTAYDWLCERLVPRRTAPDA